MKRSLPLGLAVLAAATGCTMFGPDFRETKDLALEFSPGDHVHGVRVESYNGAIHVEAADVDRVRGEASVWASGHSPEHALERLAGMGWTMQDVDGILVVTLSEPTSGGKNNCGSNLHLRVPRGWEVAELHTSNGSVTVSPGFARVVLESSNGRIQAAGDGVVHAKTSNGRVTYAGAATDLRLRTSNGRVEVTLDGDWSGEGVVSSSNGSITVECDGVMDCALDADTGNGKVYVEGPSLESGRGRLTLDTSNGSIRVRHGDQG